jgi:hypothetical protein
MEDEVTPSTATGSAAPSTSGSNTGRVVLAIVLGVLAILFIVFAIVMIIVPAGSLPGWLGHETTPIVGHVKTTYVPSTGHHPYRVVGSLIAGAVFAVGAWFVLMYKGSATMPAS